MSGCQEIGMRRVRKKGALICMWEVLGSKGALLYLDCGGD